MNYYQELTLLPQTEVSVHSIWPKLYQQLHLALVELQKAQPEKPVGVSFPQYKFNGRDASGFIGSKLRIFASDEVTLVQLDLAKWLNRLHDYVHITQTRAVPENINRYFCFSRVQVKSNVHRLARRKANREGINVEQALVLLNGFEEKKLKKPFINLCSLSGGERFQLFIARKESPLAVSGSFSSYGLSAVATVPDF
ncbi:type I-F CRISPR-associated endoribonuclease Cas6/Csy4 [Undibacterium sp. Jales W-56]|uniref:type I-F CRISPR-associated endoribonuclease Cas6/Csy4 n=1 Tax=Undibacterium sp. Jales W-56 TaxID=2897325 RepID=UPI0021CE68E1|nr:type I-F CRISPR-associated endoribonuclease Cas6/Csy4 [Undibacterium sp. Jales W-56]MCU6435462.1 type I-F CRISPR-associated endoribonuclease Cas6/Csy4 [Undibacterium sp. Jales W-56]